MEANPNLADCQNKQAESSDKVVSAFLISSREHLYWWAKATDLAAAHDECYRKCS